MLEKEKEKKQNGVDGGAALPQRAAPVFKAFQQKSLTEARYEAAVLVCCCDLRSMYDVTCTNDYDRPLSMFDRPAMSAYQALLDKSYKPPSLDMIERRLMSLVSTGLPVFNCDSILLLICD
jgi:hypothetical protein